MPLLDKPIEKRNGYQEGCARDAMQRDLAALAKKHGLTGCFLITFATDRVGLRSWGKTDEFCRAMDQVGTRVLTDIDDGRHDPLEHIETEGLA